MSIFTIRSPNREKWLDFTNQLKKDRLTLWEGLEPMIDGYLEKKQKQNDILPPH